MNPTIFRRRGNFVFNRLITDRPGAANTGDAYASFLLGAANSATLNTTMLFRRGPRMVGLLSGRLAPNESTHLKPWTAMGG